MAEIPGQLVYRVSEGNSPIAGAMIMVTFGVVAKNPYVFVGGPSGRDGLVVVTKDEVGARADQDLEMAMMDYVPLQGGFSGEIKAQPMDSDAIQRALDAYGNFRKYCKYPKGYEENLRNALTVVNTYRTSTIVVSRVE